jgi:hypothetical protein
MSSYPLNFSKTHKRSGIPTYQSRIRARTKFTRTRNIVDNPKLTLKSHRDNWADCHIASSSIERKIKSNPDRDKHHPDPKHLLTVTDLPEHVEIAGSIAAG